MVVKEIESNQLLLDCEHSGMELQRRNSRLHVWHAVVSVADVMQNAAAKFVVLLLSCATFITATFAHLHCNTHTV